MGDIYQTFIPFMNIMKALRGEHLDMSVGKDLAFKSWREAERHIHACFQTNGGKIDAALHCD